MPELVDIYSNIQAHQLNDLKIQTGQAELDAFKSEQENKRAVSSILGQQAATPLVQQGVDPTRQIAQVQQSSDRLMKAGNAIMTRDPKQGLEFIKQARELDQTAVAMQQQRLNEQKDVVSHIVSWASTIHSQPELDQAKAQVEARHPGTWAAMKLPDVYDSTSAPKFGQLALSSSTMLQQLDIAEKQLKLQTAGRYEEAKTQKEEADAVKARIEAARSREKLGKEKTASTAYEKYQTEVEKEQNLYATSLSKERAKILADPKKYPAMVKEPSLREKAWASTFGDPIKPEPSARDRALATVENEQKTAHDARTAAIETKAQRMGLVPPTKQAPKTQPNTNQFVEGKVYTDANGNKAKWNGSDWEPQ